MNEGRVNGDRHVNVNEEEFEGLIDPNAVQADEQPILPAGANANINVRENQNIGPNEGGAVGGVERVNEAGRINPLNEEANRLIVAFLREGEGNNQNQNNANAFDDDDDDDDDDPNFHDLPDLENVENGNMAPNENPNADVNHVVNNNL